MSTVSLCEHLRQIGFKIEEFRTNDRVFAKLPNCPYWPARVNKLPDYISVPDGNYPIFFFGTHEVEFLPAKALVPFAENKQKYVRNSRYQHFTEAMWEIENNFDILAFDKDPTAEDFLCEMHDIEKPAAKITDTSGVELNAEKAADVENPEINDVEGIMNLGENEWNEIFTIEEQEIHNNLTALADPLTSAATDRVVNAPVATSTATGPVNTAIIREAISITPTKIKICQTSVPVKPNEDTEQQSSLHRAALHNNCKVVVEKLSIIQINRVIQSNFSVGLMEDLTGNKKNQKKPQPAPPSSAVSTKPAPAITSDPKPKKVPIAPSNGSETKPPVAAASAHEPRKPATATANKTLSTINKNSVSRIIDTISIDSDDNQSCIIVPAPKLKASAELKRKQEKIENELKILPTIKLKLVRPNAEVAVERSEKPLATAPAVGNSDSRKPGKARVKEKKLCKSDWMGTHRNVNDKPLTFDNLFNKKFSILGSGLKIGKKANLMDAVKEEEPEPSGGGGEGKAAGKPVPSGHRAEKREQMEEEDDEGDLWPKMKDCEDDYNGQPTQNGGGMEESGGDFVDDDDGGDGEEENCAWPAARADNDMDAGGPPQAQVKHEMRESADQERDMASNKWYSNGAAEPDDSAIADSKKADKKDPWSNYMARKQKEDRVIELPDSDSELFDVILNREEPANPQQPAKRSAGNVWSHIQEYQSQFDAGNEDDGCLAPFTSTLNDVIGDAGDDNDIAMTTGAGGDAIRNMEYIQDAKWLNSTNEDFLDSPPSLLQSQPPADEDIDMGHNFDLGSTIAHKKWYDRNRLPSPPRNVPSLMDINTGRAESWVDGASPFGRAFRESSHNNRARNRGQGTNTSAKPRNSFRSPNNGKQQQQQQAFQNIPFEQLFPPFKAEYFTKGGSNSHLDPSSQQQQPAPQDNAGKWTGKPPNAIPMDPRMRGGKFQGLPPAGAGGRLPHYQYYGNGPDAIGNHYGNGMCMSEEDEYMYYCYYYYYQHQQQQHYYYGDPSRPPPPLPAAPRAAARAPPAAVPITPESPDTYTDDPANPQPAGAAGKPSNANHSKSKDVAAAAANKRPSMHQMYPSQLPCVTENGYYLPSEEEMLAYYYSCYGHPPAAFGPMNSSYHPTSAPPRPYQPYPAPNDPVSYTPASPDPEEMCPVESSNP